MPSEYLHCPKCLWSMSGQVEGQKCPRAECDGIIARQPLFSELVDSVGDPMTCGRRLDPFAVDLRNERNADRWEQFKSNGNRVCSYCGSLHPDDFFALVRQAAEAPEDEDCSVSIDPSDKSYKIYVRQPGVRNAHEGGIKFYTHHLPRDAEGKVAVPDAQQTLYAAAVRKSRARFKRAMEKKFK